MQQHGLLLFHKVLMESDPESTCAVCLSVLSCGRDKMPWQKQLKRERIYLTSDSRVWSIVAWKLREQGLEWLVASHPQSMGESS